MSTAEQIIADHRWSALTDACRCGDPTITLGAHAAHVVAALIDADKAIVELPEADDSGNYMPGYGRTRICIEGGSIASGPATDGFMASYTSHSVEHVDAYVGALLAAKRDLLKGGAA